MEIKLSEVLALLNKGLSRKEIASHYQVSYTTLKEVFEHPHVKSFRKKKVTFVDDVTNQPDPLDELFLPENDPYNNHPNQSKSIN